MTINKLAMEISKMQKKDEILEEKQEGEAEEQKVEHEEIREPASLPRMDQAGPGGAAGRAALVAVLVLFILLSVFYFYTDQKITQLDNQIGATLENSTLAVEIAEKVDQETEGFKKDIAELNKALDRHDQEIEALQDLPRETMNYLTMMLLNEYTVQADRLLDRAETEEDRKMLRQVQSVLEKAVNHYREKVSD